MSNRIFTPGTATVHAIPDLASVLGETSTFISRYVVFPTHGTSTLVALWVAHTHAIDGAASFTPYLHVHSPEKRCGKTRLLDCLELLTPEPWSCITPTEAVLYRRISNARVTLLLDEVDTVFTGGRDENKEGLRAVLNAGFERGKKVPRCVGPKHDVVNFDVFCAKALAGIGKLPTTIADRAIPIRLVRRARAEAVERFRKREVAPIADGIRASLAAWAEVPEIVQSLRDARPEIPDALGDRQADISEPLLAIAEMAGGDWAARAHAALLEVFTGHDGEDESTGVRLLAAMRDILTGADADRITTEEALRALVERDSEPWAEWWGNDVEAKKLRGPSAKLARLLRPFGIVPGTIRNDGGTAKGYRADSFADAWARYCPISSRENVTTSQPAWLLASQPKT